MIGKFIIVIFNSSNNYFNHDEKNYNIMVIKQDSALILLNDLVKI
jgi:hypothetical protein